MRDGQHNTPAERALNWIKANHQPGKGVRVHSGHAQSYPEVTGYIVPTLIEIEENEQASQLLQWLLRIQHADGAYGDPDEDRPHVFDTGQVLRGLLSGTRLPLSESTNLKLQRALGKTTEYLYGKMVEDGRQGFGTQYGVEGENPVSESVLLYVLPPLIEASRVLDLPHVAQAAQHCADFYVAQPYALQERTLTHFLAYELEALIDLGRKDVALSVLQQLQAEQQADGFVRGREGVKSCCSPGLVQLAICWMKVGNVEPALKALSWMEAHQEPSGGWRGSYGENASYFPDVELSWVPKYFLDACFLQQNLGF